MLKQLKPFPASAFQFWLVTSEEDFLRLMKRKDVHDDTEWLGRGSGCTHFFDKGCVICIKDGTWDVEWLSAVVAHEAHHAVDAFKRSIGERHTNDEIDAYLIQYLVRHALCAITGKRTIKVKV